MKPIGERAKPIVATGITGQSSGRGMWWWTNVYQRTTSVFATDRFERVHSGRPPPAGFWTGYSPVA
jgi:hypothetical protein